MPLGQRSHFQNPYEHDGDVSHASIFLVALLLLIGVAAILYSGSTLTLPENAAAPFPTSFADALERASTAVRPAPTPAARAAAPQPAAGAGPSAVRPTATPAAPGSTSASPGAAGRPAVIANAPGGAFISRTPSQADRLLAWPEGTPLELLGEETDAEGLRWVKVRDPRGNAGWIPRQSIQSLGL